MVQNLCTHKYKWKKKGYLLKLFQKWGERGIKENGGGTELNYDVLDIVKNICKCHSIPLLCTKIRKNKQ
jgi:hypothetical protein